MKKLTMLLAALIIGGCVSTPIPEKEKEFEKIVSVPNFNKDQIYSSTKMWVSKSFNSAKTVTDLDSKEDGTIVVKGVIPFPCEGFSCISKESWYSRFLMRIDIKDGKYRVGFSNIMIGWPASYSSGLSLSAYEGAVSDYDDFTAIKGRLLSMVDSLDTEIRVDKARSNW